MNTFSHSYNTVIRILIYVLKHMTNKPIIMHFIFGYNYLWKNAMHYNLELNTFIIYNA